MSNVIKMRTGIGPCTRIGRAFAERVNNPGWHPDTIIEEGLGFVDVSFSNNYASIDINLKDEVTDKVYARVIARTNSSDPLEDAAGRALAALIHRAIFEGGKPCED